MPARVFADRSELVSAVAAWDANSTAAEVTHGHISGWDVSRVGDMSGSYANGFIRVRLSRSKPMTTHGR